MTNLKRHKSLVLLLFLLFSFPYFTHSQDVSQAMEAYENLQYDISVKFFKKVWKKHKTDSEINYMCGKCILRSNSDRREAVKYLETVIGNDVNYKDANLELGKAYIYNQEFDKARKVLNYFLKNYDFTVVEDEQKKKKKKKSKKIDKPTKEIVHKLLKQMEVAEQMLKAPLDVTFENVGATVNTKRSDFNPFVTKDGQTLYYTNDKKYDLDLLELISNGYFSVFTPDAQENWSKMKSLGKNVNSSEHEIIVGLSNDENTLIMNVNWMKDQGDIFLTSKAKRKFNELKELEETVNSKFNEASGSLSKNNDTLYFCSNRPGGFGGQDIYISIQLPDGTWGKPLNLGPEINTIHNETYPQISATSKKLQFSSDRLESMGGYDIFEATKVNGKWDNIKNIGYPLNTFYDDYTISYTQSGRYGFVSQVRPEGRGGADIYKVIFNDIPAPNIIYTGTIKKNQSIINEEINIEAFDSKSGESFAKSKYSKNGKYTFVFPPGKYKIKISGSSIRDYEKTVRIPENEPTTTLITKNISVQ